MTYQECIMIDNELCEHQLIWKGVCAWLYPWVLENDNAL